jgi:sigma-E factor negative regulatory protein RseA
MAPAAVAAGFVAVASVMVVTRVVEPSPAPMLAGVDKPPATATSAVLVRNAQLDRYLAAHRSLANGAAPGAGTEHRVHIVFDGQ